MIAVQWYNDDPSDVVLAALFIKSCGVIRFPWTIFLPRLFGAEDCFSEIWSFWKDITMLLICVRVGVPPGSFCGPGSCCRISFRFKGYIPDFLNPLMRWSGFNDASTNRLSRVGNKVFGIQPLHFDSFRQLTRIFLQFLLSDRKTATSKGWHRWVEDGISVINRILCSSVAVITEREKWLGRLSR